MTHANLSRPTWIATLWLRATLLVCLGCGTIVGNPKKPGGGNPNAIQIPLLNFEVPDELTSNDEASLGLASLNLIGDGDPERELRGEEGFPSLRAAEFARDRRLLRGWGKRLRGTTREIDRVIKRINQILANEEATADGVVKFSGRGTRAALSGRIRKLAPAEELADGEYLYEAVMCHDGDPFMQALWSEDGTQLQVTRDFSRLVDGGELELTWASRVRLENKSAAGEGVRIDITSEGNWEEVFEDGAEKGLAERAVALRLSSGDLQFKNVIDRYEDRQDGQPFEGDAYLTGRTIATRPVQSEFVAYSSHAEVLCRNGFDEGAEDLWHPELRTGSPRWCLGKPLDSKRFESEEQFYQTLENLEAVGIASEKDLSAVDLDATLSCD